MSTPPADSPALQGVRRPLAPAAVDFAAREAAIAALERDYDESLGQLDALSARLEAFLVELTGKPMATGAPHTLAASTTALRDAA